MIPALKCGEWGCKIGEIEIKEFPRASALERVR